MMYQLSLARFIVGLAVLVIAAVSDIKTRRVRDELWYFLGAFAAVILAVDLYLRGAEVQYYLIFIIIGVLFLEAFIERPAIYEKGKVNFLVVGWLFIPIIVYSYMFADLKGSSLFWSLSTIPVMMLMAFLFYYLGILYGGADAKAVLTLGILLPFYPVISGISNYGASAGIIETMQILFPFTFVVLLNSSLILLVVPLFYFFYNIKNGDVGFPQMFFGYKKNVSDIPGSFVWPMEYRSGSSWDIELFPRREEKEAVKALMESDKKRAWVTPKLPFLVPMLVGYVLSFLIGNPMMHIL
ncbi:MAG: A24 family peptidase C-terminal domain-containing protein [Thermoplasmata archaeon]